MKKIIFISLILLAAGISASAQNITTSQPVADATLISAGNFFTNVKYNSIPQSNNKEDYLKKSRNQKIAGWCFVGAGAVALAIGLASFPTDGDILFTSEADAAKADRATTITVIGSALMLGSIPFFVLSNVNKRKARLSVSSQNTGIGLPSSVSKTITGISMTIPIGK